MGHTHAASGVLAGAAVLPVAPVTGGVQTAAWLVAAAGYALAPDLDMRHTSAARMWGPISGVAAAGIGRVAGGHRAGTHDVVLAPLAAFLLAWSAAQHPVTAAVAVSVAVGLSVRAVALLTRTRWARQWTVNLAVSTVAAVPVAHGEIAVPWLPWAAAVGVLVHVLGDALTTHGVPAPGSLVTRRFKTRWGAPVIRTGSWVEPAVAVACVAGAVALMVAP
ncbi:MAG: metal-dependent hydrolase [Phycicoccus sp.]